MFGALNFEPRKKSKYTKKEKMQRKHSCPRLFNNRMTLNLPIAKFSP
jgi:hypothetical protein